MYAYYKHNIMALSWNFWWRERKKTPSIRYSECVSVYLH